MDLNKIRSDTMPTTRANELLNQAEEAIARGGHGEDISNLSREDLISRLQSKTDYVGFYEREFYVLSNFSSFKILWKGVLFDTSEHVYHWEKFSNNPTIQQLIFDSKSAHEAFKLAQEHKHLRREDWDDIKEGIMLNILFAKADQHEYVRRKLLETGTRQLVEDSWRDDFWGWGPNKDGNNALGKLWMVVRRTLRAAL